MSGVVTDPRFIAITALGLDWQAAEGEAVPSAPFSPAQFIVAQNVGRNPDPTYLRPNGTHGSIFERYDGDRIITQAFKFEIEMWGGRYQIMPFLESALTGQPTVADGDMTRTGAGAANITALSLIGARPYHNLSPFVSTPASTPFLIIEMTDTPGFPVTVNIYKDVGKTELVANCTVAAAATPTALVEQNNSGLTGSITLASAATADATADIDKIIYPFENQFTRYFRLFYTDGDEVIILSDCVCQQLAFSSSENGELGVTASIMAKRKDVEPSETLTVPETELDLVIYSHSELTVTNDVGGSPSTPVVDEFAFRIENNVLQYIGNAPTPQKLIKRGWVGLRGSLQGESCDELMDIVRQARSNTAVGVGFKDMRADYLLATKTLRFDMKKVRPRLAEPGIEAELVGKTSLEFDALYDGVTPPLSVEIDI